MGLSSLRRDSRALSYTQHSKVASPRHCSHLASLPCNAEMAAVRFSEGDGCVDIWVGAGLVVQWLPHSDVINLSSKVQMRLTAFSKVRYLSSILSRASPASQAHPSLLSSASDHWS